MPDCFVVHAEAMYEAPVPIKVFRRKYKAKLFIKELRAYHAQRPVLPSTFNELGVGYPESIYAAHMDAYHMDHMDWSSSHPAGMAGEGADDFTFTQLPLE
ncbi:hypothetical protein Aura_00025 [Pseudomonas phage vB_PpuM-Aura]